MFTGIIESVARIQAVTTSRVGRRLRIPLGRLADDAKAGDSICVNGVCLTISQLSGDVADFDVMAETLRMSTLGDAKVTDVVNLERAMAANGRFGGHIVQGHVDGVGTVDQIDKEGGNCILWIAAEDDVIKQMIQKGSVAIDGISLTIVNVEKKRFSLSLIPTTLQETNLHSRKKGDTVNLEIDLISKWINKRLDQILAEGKKGGSVTWEKLRDAGF